MPPPDDALAPSPLRRIADLPGPRGWPLVGNMPGFESGRAHQIFEGWAREHGPLYRVNLAGRRLVVLSDPEASMRALRDRPDTFSRSHVLRPLFAELGFVGVFAAEGDEWRRERPLVMKALDPAHLKRFFPVMVTAARRLHDRWQAAAEKGRAIEVRNDLTRYTTDVICSLAFGVEVATLVKDDPDPVQRHLDRIFAGLHRRLFSAYPWWRLYRTRADRELEDSVRAAGAAVHGYIAQARARMEADPSLYETPGNVLEALLAAARDARISEAEVAGNVMTLLLAGEDTTAGTLAWTLHLLSTNRDAQEAARAEAAAALGDSVALEDFESARALPFLDAVLMEALRLKPVAPLLGLGANVDTEVLGVRIPRGTRIVVLTRKPGMDSTRFPDPEAFRPERWIDGSGHAADGGARRQVIPFGAGPRFCPGRYLAMLEARMALATTLAAFDVQPGGGEVRELNTFTMVPENLFLRLVPRARP